jgi:hypothetical protein
MWKKLIHFFRYSLIWYANNFAIPFWVFGHIHLTMHDYHWILNLGVSILLHLSVFLGFWFDWVNYKKDK